MAELTCERCDTVITHKHGQLCAACIADDMDWEEPEMDEDEAFLAFQCGMMADGFCTMAGSEDCDWECPRSRP